MIDRPPKSAREVEKTIYARFGDRVKLCRDGGNGWYWTDDPHTPDDLLVVATFPSSYVHVPRLREMSLERWVGDYAYKRDNQNV